MIGRCSNCFNNPIRILNWNLLFLNSEASTEIVGKPILNHRRGETLNLTCIINQSAALPRYIYWEHDNKVLNFIETNPNKIKISDNIDQLRIYSSSNLNGQLLNNELSNNHFHVHTHNSQSHQTNNYQQQYEIGDLNQPFISQLLIYDFDSSNAGNYSCRSIPQYSEAANVTVNMLNEENQLFFSNHYYSNNANLFLSWLSLVFESLILLINCNSFHFFSAFW